MPATPVRSLSAAPLVMQFPVGTAPDPAPSCRGLGCAGTPTVGRLCAGCFAAVAKQIVFDLQLELIHEGLLHPRSTVDEEIELLSTLRDRAWYRAHTPAGALSEEEADHLRAVTHLAIARVARGGWKALDRLTPEQPGYERLRQRHGLADYPPPRPARWLWRTTVAIAVLVLVLILARVAGILRITVHHTVTYPGMEQQEGNALPNPPAPQPLGSSHAPAEVAR